MKKIKFFLSLYKERDWLEEMARQGWLLSNLTLGSIYHFEAIEPAEKVFEIEKFGVSEYPQKQELTARKLALDIAKQTGWEEVTHDEDMNYYFVKDRAGDESDEFFDEEETRKMRAERYRKRYGYEQPLLLLIMLFGVTILYFFIHFIGGDFTILSLRFYMICSIIVIAILILLLVTSSKMYEDLSMSRVQWEQQKKYGVKKNFTKVQKLTKWLVEQQKRGLILEDFKEGKYLFREGTQCYDYFVDTKRAFCKRLKSQGGCLKIDSKDWNDQSTEWYEQSIEQAEGLELVCVPEKDTILYRRPHTDRPAPFDTNKESLGAAATLRSLGWFLVVFFVIGFVAGFAKGFLG